MTCLYFFFLFVKLMVYLIRQDRGALMAEKQFAVPYDLI